jgi:mono/diheme cytochrome c family protein
VSRRLIPVLGTLVALWACSDSGLPPAYRDLQVPEERLGSPSALRHGRQLFLENCALCHGKQANGHGRRKNLSSHPADFTDKSWRARQTPRKVFFTLSEGVQGTAMPSWDTLSADDRWDLTAYVLSVAEHGPEPPRA